MQNGGLGIEPGGVLLSHDRVTLPSALSCFTSVFGMGTGGSSSLWPPGKAVDDRRVRRALKPHSTNVPIIELGLKFEQLFAINACQC